MNALARTALALLVLVTGLAAIAGVQTRVDRAEAELGEHELLYLPNEKLLNHFTGGLSSVVADLLWLRCLQYTADEFHGDLKFTWLNEMCNVITRLDPYFTGVYRYGGVFLASFKGDDEAAIELLERGVVMRPDRWEIPYELGTIYFMNRKDEPGSLEAAAHYYAMAAAHPDVAEHAVALAADVQDLDDRTETEREMWTAMALNHEKPFMRELAERKLILIELRKIADALREAVEYYPERLTEIRASLNADSPAELRAAVKDLPEQPQTIADLVKAGLVERAPEDPLGGAFVIGPEGRVQSTSVADEEAQEIAHRLRAAAKAFKRGEGRWPDSLAELDGSSYITRIPPHPRFDAAWQYDPATGAITP
jgi:hypothetical protein